MAIKVGVVGIGGMGNMHLGCYANNPDAEVVAICDVDEKKLQGASQTELNIGTASGGVDVASLKKFTSFEEMAADPDIDLIDVCLPIYLHAPAAIAALRGGKDVVCEKPMAFTAEECAAMETAQNQSGKQLFIAHCLRYWPEYVEAQKIIASGEYGRPLYARFHRSSGTPTWSWNDWLRTPQQSGGCVLDMHVHDVDAALWFFGVPQNIAADGITRNDLPLAVDATWRYNDGLVVALHCSWDDNGGGFRFAFKIVLERATILRDSAAGVFQLIADGETRDLEIGTDSAYQNEIDDFLATLKAGGKSERITPASSRQTVEVAREELRQIEAKNR